MLTNEKFTNYTLCLSECLYFTYTLLFSSSCVLHTRNWLAKYQMSWLYHLRLYIYIYYNMTSRANIFSMSTEKNTQQSRRGLAVVLGTQAVFQVLTILCCGYLLLEVVDLQRRLLAVENLNNYPTYLQGRPTSTFPKLKWTSENNTTSKVNKTFNPFFIKQCSVVSLHKIAIFFYFSCSIALLHNVWCLIKYY